MIDINAITKRCVYILNYLERLPEDQRSELYSQVSGFIKSLNALKPDEIVIKMHTIEKDFRELMLKTSVTAG